MQFFQKKYDMYFLDEPFNGLDLESNYQLMQYLKKLAINSVIIISSHIMEVLYANCSDIFVLNNKTVSRFEKDEFHLIQDVLFA